jgi:hypothetical protein
MADIVIQDRIAGFGAPVHRALRETDPARERGARRRDPNGTVSAAIGLGLRLWIAGLLRGPAATWRPCGPRSAIRSLSRWCAGTYVIRIISNREARHDGPYRLPQEAAEPW